MRKTFFRDTVIKVAAPITIQSMFQASFSVIDQVMTGQLGENSVAGIGLSGKFSSIFTVVAAAVSTGAGILIAQYVGKKDKKGISRSFVWNMVISLIIAAVFTFASLLAPYSIMGIYSKNNLTVDLAAKYLRILSIGFIPLAISLIISTLIRCLGHAKLPLYASIVSAISNTVLNYLLIFGRCGFRKMGVSGAALATTIARLAECIILIYLFARIIKEENIKIEIKLYINKEFILQLVKILAPILMCEFLWSLGENIYAVVYGRMGTDPCAAMTLTNPIQSLMIGALTGVASAAGIIIGKRQGEGFIKEAYKESKLFMWYGLIGSLFVSVLILLFKELYVDIYNVQDSVKTCTSYILIAYAFIAPVKVENMILGGGVIRSGGKTKYVMIIDFVGTWCFGVPLALIFGLILKFPIYYTYFILSLEECVRLLLGIIIFQKKVWINRLS